MQESELKEMLAIHQEWLQSGKTKGRQVSFANRDLRFANLAGADLTEAVLTETNLERASLAGVRLERADLRGANLMYADAVGANLAHANIVGGHLDGIRLDGANMTDTQLAKVSLEHASLRQANLAGANAPHAKFAHSDLTLADMSRCVLTGADFSGAGLAHAMLTAANAERIKLSRATLTGADVQGANFRGADFSEAVLISVNLGSATTDGARIDPAWGAAPSQQESSDGPQPEVPEAVPQLSTSPERRLALTIVSRQIDEVRLLSRRAGDRALDSASNTERLTQLEDERTLLEHEIQREEQENARIQADIAVRVSAATTALRQAIRRASGGLAQLRAWSLTLKILALTSLGLAAATLMPSGSPWRVPLTTAEVAGFPVATLILLVIAAGLFGLDVRVGRDIARLRAHRTRIDDAAAVLQASQFVCRDLLRTQLVLDETFAMIREVLVESETRPTPGGDHRKN
jgi:uncharacterized protein YjbI with pentapeptide repeats